VVLTVVPPGTIVWEKGLVTILLLTVAPEVTAAKISTPPLSTVIAVTSSVLRTSVPPLSTVMSLPDPPPTMKAPTSSKTPSPMVRTPPLDTVVFSTTPPEPTLSRPKITAPSTVPSDISRTPPASTVPAVSVPPKSVSDPLRLIVVPTV
jgi:hypothetical protein